MLTPLDDTLRHVLPTTFDHAFTSDPRFFDRYWFAIYDPNGSEPAFNTGMCSYLNMNVIDGYAAVIHRGVQHNVRVSGEYRPYLYTEDPNVSQVGPLKISVIEPFKVLRLELAENEYGVSFDFEWRAVLAPHEELPNYTRVRGRVNQDYLRYNQVAVVNGWIAVDGERYEMKDWWGGRDHAWGVRTDVAGGEPVTGVDPPRRTGLLAVDLADLRHGPNSRNRAGRSGRPRPAAGDQRTSDPRRGAAPLARRVGARRPARGRRPARVRLHPWHSPVHQGDVHGDRRPRRSRRR